MTGVVLRPVGQGDEAFLFQLFCASRPELAFLPEPLMRMQFESQACSYQANFPGADHQVVLLAGRPVGRLFVAHLPDAIRLVDIALLPDVQGQGLGTQLIQTLQQAAGAEGKPLKLSVIEESPARRLYQRLGFQVSGQEGPRLAMTWVPAAESPGGAACSNP